MHILEFMQINKAMGMWAMAMEMSSKGGKNGIQMFDKGLFKLHTKTVHLMTIIFKVPIWDLKYFCINKNLKNILKRATLLNSLKVFKPKKNNKNLKLMNKIQKKDRMKINNNK